MSEEASADFVVPVASDTAIRDRLGFAGEGIR